MEVMCLNDPETIPLPFGLWKNCLLQNESLVPKSLRTAMIKHPHELTQLCFSFNPESEMLLPHL